MAKKVYWIAGIVTAVVTVIMAVMMWLKPSDTTHVVMQNASSVGAQIGSVAGDVTVVNPTTSPPVPKPPTAETGLMRKLVGTWKGTTTSISPAAEINITGIMQLLDTGQYNYSGEIKVHLPNGSSMLYTAVAAGSWEAVGEDRFVITPSGIKSFPQVLKRPGEPDINYTTLRQVPAHLTPPLYEDFIPFGASQVYEIVELTNSRLRAKSSDLHGFPVLYEAVRQ
jgi:hypothetical protein